MARFGDDFHGYKIQTQARETVKQTCADICNALDAAKAGEMTARPTP